LPYHHHIRESFGLAHVSAAIARLYLAIPAKKSAMRNPQVVKGDPSVVKIISYSFRSHISELDIWHYLAILAHFNQESVWAIILAGNSQVCDN
jgi:hypothetical protein